MNKNVNNELAKLLSLTSGLYIPPSLPNPDRYNPGKLLHLARINRVLYYLLEVYGSDGDIWPDQEEEVSPFFKKGRNYFDCRQATLNELDSLLGLEEIIFFKTFYHYPRLTSDLDIMVRDFNRAIKGLVRAGWTPGKIQHGNMHLTRPDRIKIGVHDMIAWGTTEFYDRELFWKNNREHPSTGGTVLIPAYEADLAAILVHIPFEKLYFDLGELLYIYSIAEQVDWDLLWAQAKKHNWSRTLQRLIGIVNGLHTAIYEKAGPLENKTWIEAFPVALRLPYEYSLWPALLSHFEKRSWSKLFSAITGFHLRYVFSGRNERKVSR